MFALEGLGDGIHFVVKFGIHTLTDGLVVGLVAVFAFRVGGGHLCGEIQLRLALHLDGLFREIEGGDHVVFGNLIHLAFHHHDVVHGGGHDHVDVGAFHVLDGGVHHELSIHAAHAHLGNRALEGDVGNGDSGRSCETCEAVGQEVLVAGNQGYNDLGFSVEILREEGTDGAIDQTGDENLILGRACLAFEETAGETTHGTVFFLVFHLKGHEISAFNGLFFATHGCEQHGVAHGDDSSAVGLLRQLAGFNRNHTTVTDIESCSYS